MIRASPFFSPHYHSQHPSESPKLMSSITEVLCDSSVSPMAIAGALDQASFICQKD
jgi:hypothetical protein